MITPEHYNELDQLLKVAVENGDECLTEFENGFVSDWCDKLESQGEEVRVSEKQREVFEKIKRKLEKGGYL